MYTLVKGFFTTVKPYSMLNVDKKIYIPNVLVRRPGIGNTKV